LHRRSGREMTARESGRRELDTIFVGPGAAKRAVGRGAAEPRVGGGARQKKKLVGGNGGGHSAGKKSFDELVRTEWAGRKCARRLFAAAGCPFVKVEASKNRKLGKWTRRPESIGADLVAGLGLEWSAKKNWMKLTGQGRAGRRRTRAGFAFAAATTRPPRHAGPAKRPASAREQEVARKIPRSTAPKGKLDERMVDLE